MKPLIVVALLGCFGGAVCLAEARAEVGNKQMEGEEDRERAIQEEGRWTRSQKDLIHGFRNMYQPCVLEVPDTAYPYRMWFFGWAVEDTNPDISGCDAIYHARSKDLQVWEIYMGERGWDAGMKPETWVPVLTASDRYYDAWHNGDPSVVLRNGKYYMAYSATSKPYFKKSRDHLDGMLLCIMGAVSRDGIHWTKTEHPLMIEEEAVQQAASVSEHSCDFHRPSLMWDKGEWRLWFDYWSPPHGLCMGCAENPGVFDQPGGFQVVHDLRNAPLIKNWPNPDVVKVRGRYYAFADPGGYPPTVKGDVSSRAWSSRQLCEAVSSDGVHWQTIGYISPDADAPACHVPQTLMTTSKGEPRLYVFYAVQCGGGPPYDYRYRAIRAMYRKE